MPINTNNTNYLPYQITAEHFILQMYHKNLAQPLTTPQSTQTNQSTLDCFDQAHEVLEQNVKYLKYCQSVLPNDQQTDFMEHMTINNRNQEMDLMGVMVAWPEISQKDKDKFNDYLNWTDYVEPQSKHAVENTDLKHYLKLALQCEHQFKNAAGL